MFDDRPELADKLFTLPDGRFAAVGYSNIIFDDSLNFVVQTVIGEPNFSLILFELVGGWSGTAEELMDDFCSRVTDWIEANT